MLSWRLASQLLFHLAPGGGFSGSSCGAEKGEDWAQLQLVLAWAMPGKQREVGGLHTGDEVPFERHCRS